MLGYNKVELVTPYFKNEVLRKRPYLAEGIRKRVIENPYKKEVQSDGRIRFRGRVEELGGRYLRVVILRKKPEVLERGTGNV